MTDAISQISNAQISNGQISYAEFGRRFFALAVTEERILAGIDSLAGQPIDVGPMGMGPGRIAKVTATGQIGQPSAVPIAGEAVSFRVTLPVSLTFEVHLQVDTHRFQADLEVPLILTALAADLLSVYIDVTPPQPNQVKVDLRAEGLRATVMSKVVGVEGELQRFVAKYIKREVEKPSIMKARVIDVAQAIEGAWRAAALSETPERHQVIDDLAGALEAEIAERPDFIEGLTD